MQPLVLSAAIFDEVWGLGFANIEREKEILLEF
jgi:hypothetical protein